MKPVPCVACGRELDPVSQDTENQPYRGTTFMTHGHYGSTAFDPMDGEYLEVNVCDVCLVNAREMGRVLIGRDSKPVLFNGSIVGHCRTPDRPLMRWFGTEASSLEDEDPANNILHVDEDVLRSPENYPEITFHVPPGDLLED